MLLYKSYNDEKLQPPKVESAAGVRELLSLQSYIKADAATVTSFIGL